MTDAHLLEASRRGERSAFGRLVERYQSVVCAVSYSATGDHALSEDVAQETFLTAWRQLDKLNEPGNLRGWLCGIARNLGRRAIRRSGRETPSAQPPEAPQLEASPFDAVALAESERIVWEALRGIPENYREALVLYYRENRSAREVADALGISESAVQQRLSRGRRQLSERVSALVEKTLERGRPGPRFSAVVVAALPTITSPPVDRGATAGAASPQGGNMLKLALISGAVIAAAGGAIVASTSMDRGAGRDDADSPTAASSRSPDEAPVPTALMNARTNTAGSTGPSSSLSAGNAGTGAVAGVSPGAGPARGPADAPVEIVVFTDFGCPLSGKVLGTIDELWEDYPNQLRLVIRQFPVLARSKLAAEAALAAHERGRFWELHDLMLANQDDLSLEALLRHAVSIGLDADQLRSDLEDGRFKDAVAAEMAEAMDLGVRGTPYFLINGRSFAGARPIGQFHGLIREELAAVSPDLVPPLQPHQHPEVPDDPAACDPVPVDCESSPDACEEVVIDHVVKARDSEATGADPSCGG